MNAAWMLMELMQLNHSRPVHEEKQGCRFQADSGPSFMSKNAIRDVAR